MTLVWKIPQGRIRVEGCFALRSTVIVIGSIDTLTALDCTYSSPERIDKTLVTTG